jgi:hypothetical protein
MVGPFYSPDVRSIWKVDTSVARAAYNQMAKDVVLSLNATCHRSHVVMFDAHLEGRIPDKQQYLPLSTLMPWQWGVGWQDHSVLGILSRKKHAFRASSSVLGCSASRSIIEVSEALGLGSGGGWGVALSSGLAIQTDRIMTSESHT